ncbi:Transcription factor jumonji/aspartyl beta-hydroxylase [Niveomyces insectorum RCEF 264]|uniref:Transcription factor jumonji/aspartyl beta-hydroxylase n=1 Tax=Niveomyces insectorum RCEF 264 TaxID=1081102 RepID=A0A167W2P0_9HYPO|nr:Transcription factor jumonji/aspartyl beta-hydroxylase [Niveomyces insectorum RCEF 264]
MPSSSQLVVRLNDMTVAAETSPVDDHAIVDWAVQRDFIVSAVDKKDVVAFQQRLTSTPSTEQLSLCIQQRDRLLQHQAALDTSFAVYENIFHNNCLAYRQIKDQIDPLNEGTGKRKRLTHDGGDGDNGENDEWHRFAKQAAAERTRFACLKAIADQWGTLWLQHYNILARPLRFCRKLRTAAYAAPYWPHAAARLNLIILFRFQQNLRSQIQDSPFPVLHQDLEQLVQPDPKREKQMLAFFNDAGGNPGAALHGLGMDVHGLVVRSMYAVKTLPSLPQLWVDGSTQRVQELAADMPAANETGQASQTSQVSQDSQADDANYNKQTNEAGRDNQATEASQDTQTNEADQADTACQASKAALTTKAQPACGVPRTPLPTKRPLQSSSLNAPPLLNPMANDRLSRIRLPPATPVVYPVERRATKPRPRRNYTTPMLQAPAVTPPEPTALTRLVAARCCPRVSDARLAQLDRGRYTEAAAALQIDPKLLCGKHWAAWQHASAKVTATAVSPLTLLDRPPAVFTPGIVTGRPPQYNPDDDEAFRKTVIKELDEAARDSPTAADSHGAVNARLVRTVLSHARQPTFADTAGRPAEALLLTGAEAAAALAASAVATPIIVEGQQTYSWPTDGVRPIDLFLCRLGPDAHTAAVQIPSRPKTSRSFAKKTLREIRARFYAAEDTKDPWNLLDLANPLQSNIVPAFLGGDACSMLTTMRNRLFQRLNKTAERPVTQAAEYAQWRDLLEWALLSEGGHCTAPHMDSHGLATWITVQEGHFGFGWMAHPSDEERAAWLAEPSNYVSAAWRYVVLRPGQTVYFPPGTVHFVFRLRQGQTLALGGHVLSWRDIGRWARVVHEERAHPDATNEDIEHDVDLFISLARELVTERVQRGEADELGGLDEVNAFFAVT